MKFKPTNWSSRTSAVKRLQQGFTLAEVLAALTFMAIVIPVSIEGLRVANLAGQVGDRKAAAARIAERVLTELIVTQQGIGSSQRGTTFEGNREYRWQMRSQAWDHDDLQVMTVQVWFDVQGAEYDVKLSTLYDSSESATVTEPTTETQP